MYQAQVESLVGRDVPLVERAQQEKESNRESDPDDSNALPFSVSRSFFAPSKCDEPATRINKPVREIKHLGQSGSGGPLPTFAEQ